MLSASDNDMSNLEIPECPVYSPSEQDFNDPFIFLQKVADQASKYGMCKIVSPLRARVPADVVLTKQTKGFKFETTVQPLNLSHHKMSFTRGRKYKYREFERMANKAFLRLLPSSDSIENYFWLPKNGTVEYGINVDATAFSSDPTDSLGRSKWNLKDFPWLSKSSLRFLKLPIPGITDPMLYIGMLFSMFAWHVEDHYLYSINYHHCGEPKTWYGIPSDFASQFEKVVSDQIYNNNSEDEAFKLLAEKTTMFSPKVLIRNNIPVYKAIQKEGEFVVTFPKAYHAGFSHGFNCGEAVNFAMNDWFQFGEEARQRYALLDIVPIIPFEEMLCKHAMLLYQNFLKNEASGFSAADISIKPCFVRLVKFYEQAFQRLGSILRYSLSFKRPNTHDDNTCEICNRDCYVAYMSCDWCFSDVICLNHVWDSETEWMNCSCGTKRRVVVREEMSTLVVAAQKFEQIIEAELQTEASLIHQFDPSTKRRKVKITMKAKENKRDVMVTKMRKMNSKL